jgi:hypothetical protein
MPGDQKQIELTDQELTVLKELEENCDAGKTYIPKNKLNSVSRLEQSEKSNLFRKFESFGFLLNSGNVITEKGVEYLHGLDNPPAKDHWVRPATKFESKQCSTPAIPYVKIMTVLILLIVFLEWILVAPFS